MKILLVSFALGAAAIAAHAGAQGPVTAGGKPSEQEMTRQQALQRADTLFEMFDLNRDGVVTRAEAEQVGQKLLMARAATHRDVAPGLGGHTLKLLERRFAGVQSVTRQQFEAAMLDHFDAMDSNHDGVLTLDERSQARSARAEAQPGQ